MGLLQWGEPALPNWGRDQRRDGLRAGRGDPQLERTDLAVRPLSLGIRGLFINKKSCSLHRIDDCLDLLILLVSHLMRILRLNTDLIELTSY